MFDPLKSEMFINDMGRMNHIIERSVPEDAVLFDSVVFLTSAEGLYYAVYSTFDGVEFEVHYFDRDFDRAKFRYLVIVNDKMRTK